MVIQLTAEMKEGLATNSYSLLTGYNCDPEDFHFRLVSYDEMWLYH